MMILSGLIAHIRSLMVFCPFNNYLLLEVSFCFIVFFYILGEYPMFVFYHCQFYAFLLPKHILILLLFLNTFNENIQNI